MWNMRILLIIVISVFIHDIVCAYRKCEIRTGFDVDNLEGTWHFIARIGGRRSRIRCGFVDLRRISAHRFNGITSGMYGIHNKTRTMRMQAYYRNNVLMFRYHMKTGISEEISMMIRTCNGETEFSLELPKEKMYWIFGKEPYVTPVFLKYYRELGQKVGSILLRLNNTNCPKLHHQVGKFEDHGWFLSDLNRSTHKRKLFGLENRMFGLRKF